MNRTKSTVLLSAALLLVLGNTPSRAVELFSVDIDTDQLVKVDSQTGAVTAVGALGVDVTGAELAVMEGGQLFMLDLQPGLSPVLHEVDPSTGGVLSSTPVTTPGSTTAAEGLAAFAGQLVISFWTQAGDGISNAVGDLAFDGSISNVVEFDPSGPPGSAGDTDLDFLTFNASGDLFGGDAKRPGSGADLFSIDLDAELITFEKGYAFADANALICAFSGDDLFGIEVDRRKVLTFDSNLDIASQVTYQGNLSGLAQVPQSLGVEIDIKPGSDPNAIHPLSRGLVPVAILGSDAFGVLDVDPDTLAFGPDGAALSHVNPHYSDVNEDAFTDLIGHFAANETGIAFGDTEACLTGETFDATPFEACDDIKTVPACGIGFELALLPPLMWARYRRRRPIH